MAPKASRIRSVLNWKTSAKRYNSIDYNECY